MSEKDKDRELTAEDARRMLEQERDERLRRCNAAIGQALQEHGCKLVAAAEITEDGRLGARVQLVVVP